MPLAFKKQWLSDMFTSPTHVLILLVFSGALHSFSYLAYLLKMDLGLVWNVKEVKTELRLMALVETEKIYRESDLNLKSLADRLFITPHQLSQYLNERLGSDFRSFINSYRVAEAKKLLSEQPDLSILSICYDVGFGSKSAFNSVFKKETGQTPREFRDTAMNGQD